MEKWNERNLANDLIKQESYRGITSERLSEICEVNATHIRSIEGGRRFPSVELLVRMCNALHTSPNYLLQDLLVDNELDAQQGLSKKCRDLSKSQLERLDQIIDLVFLVDKAKQR